MDEQFSLCLTASLLSLLWFCVCDGNPNQIVYQFCHSSKYFYTPTINGAMKMFGNSGNYYCVFWAAAAHFFQFFVCVRKKNLNTYICLCVCLLHAKKKTKNRSKYRVFSQFSTLFTYYGAVSLNDDSSVGVFQKYNNSNGTAYKPRANWKRITMMMTATRCSPPTTLNHLIVLLHRISIIDSGVLAKNTLLLCSCIFCMLDFL